ncbi:hypothetical protein TVAG_161130 [Trichomonas vaginalis G3]|uniref:Uncharacterized protein n=1 Tax=Trichomonas vaginalis (strain ATCC PRA-98 / G3) TaxID=412133 RepID=A2E4W8_TRIV3|nr:hypothetical protein TVAGG3_0228140 [Trichomonas vaginalis G3]EAY12307.1 hypothetical protein TVAG_161130 [Trichomonas vaginalis G3]KAI5552421.1 hypothetical protein TVAGG3_0228140 [Trichomonas vaginalis G3]|eukprot:XP_001324530.1 hypothetical protein [Trichomonas vaginalis G3]
MSVKRQVSVNEELDSLQSRDDTQFYNKVSTVLDRIIDKVRDTEERLTAAEQSKIDQTISSGSKSNKSTTSSKKKAENPFKMPEIPPLDNQIDEKQIKITPKRKLIKKPVKEPTMEEVLDALFLLQREISDIRENQKEMEDQIKQIQRLIE